MNWHKRRFEVGVGCSPFLLREIEKRKNNIEACIFGVFGGAGRGKTYAALRLCEIVDPKFNPEEQVAFGPEAFLHLIGPDSPLKMGQCILVDESQFAAGSRNWYNEIQKDLMAHLEAVRSKGFIIFIIALNIATLDVIARNYTLTHMVYMKKRGQGVAYRFYSSPFGKEPYKNRLGVINLKLPGAGECTHPSCLRCIHSGIARRTSPMTCMNVRVRYERKKREYLANQARASQEKRDAKEEKAKGIDYANYEREVDWNIIGKLKNGRYDPKSITIYLRNKYQTRIGESTGTTVRKIHEDKLKPTTSTDTPPK
jgi:hypothetical protein